MKKTLLLTTVLGILLSVQPAWSQPLAERMPEGCIAYFGWAGKTAALDGSMLGQLLSEPGLTELLGNIHQVIAAQMRGRQDQQEIFQAAWSMGGIVWQKPCAVALFDLKLPAPGDRSGKEPRFTAGLLIDLGKDRAAFDAQLQKVLAKIPRPESRPAGGKTAYEVIPTPAGPVAFGYVGDMFFLTLGEGAPETVLALTDGKGKPLAKQPSFSEAMKDVCRENVLAAYFVDVTRIYQRAGVGGPARPATAATAPARDSKPATILKALGLDGVTVVAGATSIVDKGLYERFRCFTPAPHRGLLALAGKPLDAKALSGVPGDAEFLLAAGLNPAELLAEFKRGLALIEPEKAEQVPAVLSAAGEALGLDIEKDLLATVGEQWLIYSAPSLGGMLTGTVLTVQLKDAEHFAQSLGKLEAFFRGMLDARSGGKAGLRSCKAGEVEIHYLSVRERDFPLAPAWAIHKGRLYLAAWPQVVEAAVAGTAEKPLPERAEFAALRKRFSPNASVIVYVDAAQIVRQLYGVGLIGMTALGNHLPRELQGIIDPHTLPALPTIEKYLWPCMTAVSSDAKGVVVESFGSVPGIGLLGGSPVSPLAVAVLLPVLGQARESAKQSMSAASLNGIGKGIAMYGTENNDQLPPDLYALVKIGAVSHQMLLSPLSGREVEVDPKTRELVGGPDYIYLGAGLNADDVPGNAILAYERPELAHAGKINVLYFGLNVRTMTLAEFQRALGETMTKLAEARSKPPPGPARE